jgi:hypothetical protein
MKRLLLGLMAAAMLLAPASLASTQIVIEWEAQFGDLNADIAYDVQPTGDGGFIAAGFGTQGNFEHILVVKTDAQGQAQWQRTLNLNNYSERAYDVIPANDGGYLVIGRLYLPGAADYRPWLIKLDADGSTVWSSEAGLSLQANVDSAVVRGLQRADGSLLLAGSSRTANNGREPWVATASPTGTLQSLVVYPALPGTTNQGATIEGLAATPDGGFVLLGSTIYPWTPAPILWKFDADGQSEWVWNYGSPANPALRAANAVLAVDGGYLLAGCEAPNCTDTMLLKTDALGNPLWSRRYEQPLNNQGRDLIERPGGGYLLAQTSVDAVGSNAYSAELLELGADGELVSVTSLPGGAQATFLTRLTALDDGFVAAGYVDDGTGIGNLDFYLARGTLNDPAGAPLACPDFDGNQWVDVGDLAMIAAHWQNHSASPEWNPIFDRNGDGVVDTADILLVAMQWGAYCGS